MSSLSTFKRIKNTHDHVQIVLTRFCTRMFPSSAHPQYYCAEIVKKCVKSVLQNEWPSSTVRVKKKRKQNLTLWVCCPLVLQLSNDICRPSEMGGLEEPFNMSTVVSRCLHIPQMNGQNSAIQKYQHSELPIWFRILWIDVSPILSCLPAQFASCSFNLWGGSHNGSQAYFWCVPGCWHAAIGSWSERLPV